MSRAKGEQPYRRKGLVPDPGMNDMNGPQESPMAPRNDKPASERSLGDYAQFGERYNRHWDVEQHDRRMPPQRPTVVPPTQIPEDKIIEVEYLCQKLKECLTCGTWFVKNPLWVEPPITARIVDHVTPATGIYIAAGATVTVLTLTVPDRFVFVMQKFGNAVETPSAYPGVRWQILDNDRPVSINGGPPPNTFTAQMGDPVNPTIWSTPIIVKYNHVLRVTATSTDGNPHSAFARMMGWLYPAKTVTNDGSFSEFHQV